MHEHVSYPVAVLCASMAARLPPIQQLVFSQHALLLNSGNAPWFTVKLTAAAVHIHQHALRMLTCPCHRVLTAVTNSKKRVSSTRWVIDVSKHTLAQGALHSWKSRMTALRRVCTSGTAIRSPLQHKPCSRRRSCRLEYVGCLLFRCE